MAGNQILRRITNIMCLIMLVVLAPPAFAKVVSYNLTIAPQRIRVGNKSSRGIAINGQVPGPVLRFHEGDVAVIKVHNALKESTSLHWHGMLVANDMDGVPYLTFAPIRPGASFTYRFPIRQNGTYWYHSHSDLQEQMGAYGAIVIEPREKRVHANQDHVVVLSDWSTQTPSAILKTLKRGSDWYSIEKGTAQSLLGAWKENRLGAYFKRELLRMGPMDISDVAYDAFLANGHRQISYPAQAYEHIRVRLVNASSMTNFYLQYAGGPMTIIAADGQRVVPIKKDIFLMAIAETYDVLLKVPSQGSYELRATAEDGSGYASIWIGRGPKIPAPEVPQPNLYDTMGKLTFSRVFALAPAGTMAMSTKMSTMNTMTMPMGSQNMMGTQMTRKRLPPRSGKRHAWDFTPLGSDISHYKNLVMDGSSRRPWSPYKDLKSIEPTNFPKKLPVQVFKLTLNGDMQRYVWMINNQILSARNFIRIKKGVIAKFILINKTMMHHPMHLHGHLFRLENGQGRYSPLKHTVDVAPMSTVVIEFKADKMGDWFFHCHMLYHMQSGMARVVHYNGFAPSSQVLKVRHKLFEDPWYAWGHVEALNNMTSGMVTTSNTRNILTATWDLGWQKSPKTAWELVATYKRYVNRFFSYFAGGDFLNNGGGSLTRDRGVFGINYLLPLNLESEIWIDHEGGFRASLSKRFVIIPRLILETSAEYDSHDYWRGDSSLNYMIDESLSVAMRWDSEYGIGAGLLWRF